jgi:hypothetical protein
MMAFSRAFIAGENLAAVTLVNSPTLTFLVLRACGTGLRAGKVSILRDFTWIDLRDALLTSPPYPSRLYSCLVCFRASVSSQTSCCVIKGKETGVLGV